MSSFDPRCIFCKIAEGTAEGFRVWLTPLSCAFLTLPQPLSPGHTLIVPKYHAAKMHELPDEYLADILKVAKDVAIKLGFENYNIIQNNGKLAYQSVNHVHLHVIDKPDKESGLVVKWPPQKLDTEAAKDRTKMFDEAGEIQKPVLGETVWSKEELEEFGFFPQPCL